MTFIHIHILDFYQSFISRKLNPLRFWFDSRNSFPAMLQVGKIPEEWFKTIIVPFFIIKGKGDAGKCENHKGIALIPHFTK